MQNFNFYPQSQFGDWTILTLFKHCWLEYISMMIASAYKLLWRLTYSTLDRSKFYINQYFESYIIMCEVNLVYTSK